MFKSALNAVCSLIKMFCLSLLSKKGTISFAFLFLIDQMPASLNDSHGDQVNDD